MLLAEVMGYFPAATQNLLLISLCAGVHRGQHPPSSHVGTSFSSNPQAVK